MILVFSFFLVLCLILVVLLCMWIYWSELLSYGLFREVKSAFECGFDSKGLSRLPFSFRFFLIVIFFVLLDVEVCLLLHLPYEFFGGYYMKRFWFLLFLLILGGGMVEELRRGLLFWK